MDNETKTNFHDVPDTDGIYSSEQADKAIRRLEADIKENPNHPFWKSNSPVQQDWLDYQTRLYQIKHQGDSDKPRLEQAMAEAMETQEQEQADRIEQGEKIMDALVDAGFEYANIPDDLTEAEELGLETQLMAARGEWDAVLQRGELLIEKLPALPMSARKLLEDFKQSNDSEERILLVTRFARICIETWHRQTGFSRPKGEG